MSRNRHIVHSSFCVALLLALFALPVGAAADEPQVYPIAGVAPDQRPQGAPTITEFAKDGGWYELALTGVVQPYPMSLRFLEDQEAWYTPFTHAGMTGPYDIRGWHTKAAGTQSGPES